MEKILAAVLKKIKPTRVERARLERVASELVERVNRTCAKLRVEAKAMLVGSAARGTWLRSERDIDVFILFPEDLPREELEEKGLAVAREAAGKRGKERYAEHPYVTTKVAGFEVDLVPCYEVADASRIKSAVDRTPHHNRYVGERLEPGLIDEVLLLKQFMSGVGAYGAELKVQGFSGYLCEILALHYRSFKEVVDAGSRWKPGVVVDLEGSYPDQGEARALFEGQPLIVIDPVDPNRNAAAAVSMQNFATFVRACQDFLREPRMEFFFPKAVRILSNREIETILRRRGTTLLCIAFESPDVVPDVLYPQLRKTERALLARLGRAGFEILRSDVWSNRMSVMMFELTIANLPDVQARIGPPIEVEVGDFIRKYKASVARFAGPFIDAAGRLLFEVERRQKSARQVIESALAERTAFGRHVAEAIADGYSIYEGAKVTGLCGDRKFARFLSEYLNRSLPWYR